jgi:hypothetical protein
MIEHVFVEVAGEITVDGRCVPPGRYHGHRISRMKKGREDCRVLIEVGKHSVGGIRPVDVTAVVGSLVRIVA